MKKTVYCFLLTIFTLFVIADAGQGQTNDMAPDFTLKDVYGQAVTLSQYRGRPIFLVFGTTWCPNCKSELPQMKSIYEKYRGKGLIMFGVDIMESQQKVLSFARSRKINFPMLLDSEGQVADSYGVVGVPAKVLIDQKGRIICWNCRTLEDKLKQLMP